MKVQCAQCKEVVALGRFRIEGDEIEIRCPDDWEVISQGSAALGGFVNNARSQPGAKRRLIVTGLAIMGGVEVKN